MGVVCNVGWSVMYERRMTHIGDEVVMRGFGQAQDAALHLSFNRSHSSILCLLSCSLSTSFPVVSAVLPTIAQVECVISDVEANLECFGPLEVAASWRLC